MSEAPKAYTCPECGLVSYHPKDVEHKYCVRCHQFESDRARIKLLEKAEGLEDIRKAMAGLTDEDRIWLAKGGIV
jgi:hypothetical protein